MKRSYLLYLCDIKESIEKIQRYVANMSYHEFISSEVVVDAVVRNLEVIGEAGSNIPDEVQKAHPDVPWKKMRSMRNILSHRYFGIDFEIIWKTINESLPGLLKDIRTAIAESEAEKDSE